MNTTTNHLTKRLRAGLLATGLVLGGSGALAACGSSSGSATPASTASAATAVSTAGTTGDTTAIASADTTANSGGPVLPVASNPITNTSTVQALTIDSVLVENNIDGSGTTTSDHLEIALTNTGAAELTAFEVYYTFTDPTSGATEGYYAQLPASFTIPAGGTRIAHFDNTGATDHFPVNAYSIYYTDTNALDVTVTVSATDTAIQTTTIQKGAGGPETVD